jgi:response regulator RpfG family c-di-GMP phosphodiesterase
MAGMEGPDLLGEIHRISPSTAGMLISGKDDQEIVIPPGTPFLKKPFSSEELYAVVELVLARSRSLRADLANKMERTTELVERAEQLSGELAETMHKSTAIKQESCEIRKLLLAAIPAHVASCTRCGRPIGQYIIARDGIHFGVAIGGDIKIHGLTLKKAQELASLLNSINHDS